MSCQAGPWRITGHPNHKGGARGGDAAGAKRKHDGPGGTDRQGGMAWDFLGIFQDLP